MNVEFLSLECPGGVHSLCSKRGKCDDGHLGNGTCTCEAGFKGTACELCSDGFYGPNCKGERQGGRPPTSEGFVCRFHLLILFQPVTARSTGHVTMESMGQVCVSVRKGGRENDAMFRQVSLVFTH